MSRFDWQKFHMIHLNIELWPQNCRYFYSIKINLPHIFCSYSENKIHTDVHRYTDEWTTPKLTASSPHVDGGISIYTIEFDNSVKKKTSIQIYCKINEMCECVWSSVPIIKSKQKPITWSVQPKSLWKQTWFKIKKQH